MGSGRRQGNKDTPFAGSRESETWRCTGVQLSLSSTLGQHQHEPETLLCETLCGLAGRYIRHRGCALLRRDGAEELSQRQPGRLDGVQLRPDVYTEKGGKHPDGCQEPHHLSQRNRVGTEEETDATGWERLPG